MNETENILIDRLEYDDLKITATKYSMLLQVLIDEAELNDSWSRNKTPLKFDDEKLNMVLNLIEKKDYMSKIKTLEKEEEAKKGDE